MVYRDSEERKKKVREYLKKNPKATWKDLNFKLKIKTQRLYGGGMAEAYNDAGIEAPRTFKRKTKDEKRKIIADFIRKNPKAGGHTIREKTKIDFFTIFKNTKEAFEYSGIVYPRDEARNLIIRKKEVRRKAILDYIKKNPLAGVSEIGKGTNTHPYLIFKNMAEIYKLAGLKMVRKEEKWRLKKRKIVVDYIKKNPLATQREINNSCKTHVQKIFDRGIYEAYELANVRYPYERLKLYGASKKNIRKRAEDFEKEIAVRLSGYGNVNRLVKTRRGFVDIILERKGKKLPIELKDYQSKEISISQVNQLNKYLEDLNINVGVLICHKKPRKDKFLIGNNRIFILEKMELNKIPEILKG